MNLDVGRRPSNKPLKLTAAGLKPSGVDAHGRFIKLIPNEQVFELEAQRQVVQAADEARRVGERARVHQLQVVEPCEQPLEADACLGAGGARAGTEVLAVTELVDVALRKGSSQVASHTADRRQSSSRRRLRIRPSRCTRPLWASASCFSRRGSLTRGRS